MGDVEYALCFAGLVALCGAVALVATAAALAVSSRHNTR